MTDQEEQIAALLRRLDVLPERQDGVDRRAQYLSLFALFSRRLDLPRSREGGSKRTEEELIKLGLTAHRLCEIIQTMHGDSFSALEELPDAHHPLSMTEELEALINACSTAVGRLREEPRIPGPKGAPRKRGAREMTRYAARIFR